MATETQLPHLISLERVLGLPMVKLAVEKSAETYSRVKNFHQLMYGAFTTVEVSFNTATKLAMPIAKPLATRFENQIQFFDGKLCLGLDKIEEKMPLVKKHPEQIVNRTYTSINRTLMNISVVNILIAKQAEMFVDVTYRKADEILNTYYGDATVKKVVSTSVLINNLLDKYFPPIEGEELIEIKTSEEDKLMVILQTIGCLTTKACRRIYSYVVHYLNEIKKDYLMPYVNLIVEFLCLTRHIFEANEKHVKKCKLEKKCKSEQKKRKSEEKKYTPSPTKEEKRYEPSPTKEEEDLRMEEKKIN